jgi:magnesium chelatase family protein
MLFKTQSASVYGIDAYLVEVEVDVGSARMQDFNVVGLPDNAVKESRERIKSALRNCGFEFPHGQGVTINLAPADVRKEGSGFDLPMALGLVGCQGQFFGKQLDKMMFLGELSLDGSVRSVRGPPVRLFWRPDAGVPLHASDDPALRFEDLGPAAGPH